MLLSAVILSIVLIGFCVGPCALWYLISDDRTAMPGKLGGAALLLGPVSLIAAYNLPGPPTITWAATQLALIAWLDWQWLVAAFGFGLVYFLRLDRQQRARSGYVTYVGYSGRDFAARRREHQDDRNPGWAPWKADVDWTISGPAFRRITEGAARRHETRMIRTLTYATRMKLIPPIENNADTHLRGLFHPLLRARYTALRCQGLILPARRLKLAPAVEREHPGPEGLHAAPPVEQMGIVVDAKGAEGSASSTPGRPSESSRPAPADQARSASRPGPGSDDESADPAPSDRRGPVATETGVASHPAVVPLHPPHPPEGGMPDDTLQRDATIGSGATSDPGDSGGAGEDESVADTGLGDEVELFLARMAPSGTAEDVPPVRGARGNPGGPGWVQLARQLRAEDPDLSLGEIQATLEGAGFSVSRSTISRWLRRPEGGPDAA